MKILLPIDDYLPAITAGLTVSPCAVITAEPGAGKSTRVAPAVAGTVPGQVLLLQPRRVAARAVAERIAQEHGSAVGGDFAGYRVRFENKTTARTRIIVMTEGLLARRIQDDPFLEGVSCVIIDEFHERSIHTDTALALVREIQQSIRPDLKLVIMSATMDAGPVRCYLGDCPLHSVPGRTFPLTVHHAPRVSRAPLEARVAEAIAQAMASGPLSSRGHILVFLPGMAEIRKVAVALPAAPGTVVHILHSSVRPADQQAALEPAPHRKIILATNIAETSLTIDGVECVIDSGLARVPVHDTRLGMDRLEVRRVSKASARQRAGRAGRSGPGVCYRLYTQEEFNALSDYDVPEIQRLDLAPMLLSLKIYGVRNPQDFSWFDAPSPQAIARACTLLRLLGALDEGDALTPLGRRMAVLPLHPRLSAVLGYGADAGFAEEAAWLCALLEAGDVSPVSTKHTGRESDPLDRLAEVLTRPTDAPWAVRNAAQQLARLTHRTPQGKGHAERSATRDGTLTRALLRGFPDRVIARRAPGDARGVMVGKRGTLLARESSVHTAAFYLGVDAREKPGSTESLVASASAIEVGWLLDIFPHLCRSEETIRLEGERPVGVRREMFIDLVLSEKDLGRLPEGMSAGRLVKTQLLEKFGSARGAVLSDESSRLWLARYLFLKNALPGEALPEPDYDALLEAACDGATSSAAALKNVLAYLQGLVADSRVLRLLAEEAPDYLPLPSGNRARVQYPDVLSETGALDATATPAIAARVQELFGLAETPRIARGSVPVTIQLLSPARRPVQITRDLRSFWNGAYQEVRKELRARYPKHPWPEDPWTAPAVNIGGRRRSSG